MNFYQITILLSQGILVSLLILMLFRLRKKLGIGILFACLGLFQFMQVFLSSTVYVELAKNFLVSPGSSVLFTASLFAVLIIYIKEDASETRKIIYALLITNIIMSILIQSFGWNIKESSTYNPFNVSTNLFNNNAWVLIIGTIALFFDSLLIIIIYEFTSRHLSNLFLQICLTMLIVVSFDTTFFSIIAFWNFDNLNTILVSGLISKGIFAIFYSVIFSIYLKYIDAKEFKTDYFKINDVFKPLSYRQKFEIAKSDAIKTSEEVKLKEIKYQTLTNTSSVGIFHTRTDGYTTFVNPKWCEISGLSMIEALGDGWFKAVHPDDIEKIKNEWKLATIENRTSETQYRFLLSDGSTKWVLGRAVPEINDNNQIIGYVGTITDITNIKLAENTIRESEEKLRLTIENSPLGICVVNFKGAFQSANKAFQKIVGYTEEELLKMSLFELTHSDYLPKNHDLFNKMASKESTTLAIEKKYIHKNGSTVDVRIYAESIKDEKDKDLFFMAFVEDISERKKAEAKLVESERKYRSLFDTANDAILLMKDNRVVDCNAKTLDLYECKREEIIGASPEAFSPERQADGRSSMELSIEKTKEVLNGNPQVFEWKQCKLDKTEFDSEISLNKVHIENEDQIFAIVRDITERKKAEDLIRQNKEVLEEMGRVAKIGAWSFDTKTGKGTWTDKVARIHELNTADDTSMEIGLSFYKAESRIKIDKAIQDAIELGKSYDLELELTTAKGTHKWVRTIGHPTFQDGKVVKVHGSFQDITERKSAEVEIRQMTENLQNVFNETADAVTILDFNGNVINVNNTYINKMGYTRKELVGKALFEFDPTATKELVMSLIGELRKKRHLQIFETVHQTKSGVQFPVEIFSKIIIYNGEEVILSIARDITDRKAHEKKILESEAKLKAIFENKGTATFIINEKGKILMANNALVTLTGLSLTSILDNEGRTWMEFTHPDDVEQLKANNQLRAAGKLTQAKTYETRMLHQSGNYKNVILNAESIVGTTETVISMMDITDRKKAEQELYESRNKLAKIFDVAPTGIGQVNNRVFTELNTRFCKMLGYTKEELIGKDATFIYPSKKDYDQVGKDKYEQMKKSGSGRVETRFLRKDGSIIDVELASTMIDENDISKGSIFTALDITEKNKALQNLKESENRYRNLFDHTPIALWEEDLSEVIQLLNKLKKKGLTIDNNYFEAHPEVLQSCISKIKIIDVNQATLYNHNADSKVHLYSKLPELFTDVSVKALLNWVVGIANEETLFTANSQTITLNGEVRDIFMKAYLDKNSAKMILAVMDVTEQKKAEQEIKKYQEHLEDLVKQRTAALETSNKEMEAFTYSVSHDLRAPLRAINGFAGYLEKDYTEALDKEGRRYLNIIRESSIKMDLLISDLLKLSRTSRAELEFVKLNMFALAKSMYLEVASEEEQNEFEFIVHELPEVHGDITSIKQLWTNLIGNAVKYSAKSAIKKIEIGFSTENKDFITYFVKDWGCGFDEEYKHKLFEIFQRLTSDRDYKGSGVGLALVKRIIDKHRGKIWANSDGKSGAIFYFSLPKQQQK